MSVLIFLGLCALLALFDWKHRAVPRILPVLGTVLAAVVLERWAILGLLAGVVVGVVADLPAGDVMVGGMLGAWLGVEGTLLAWIIALLAGNIVWAMWEDRMIDWPGEWPFTPLLLVPACAIVLGRGV